MFSGLLFGFPPDATGTLDSDSGLLFASRASKPGKKMKVNAPDEIRFCDEYERLLEEFLHALARWKQVAGSDSGAEPAKERSEIELIPATQGYVGALVALQGHSRRCSLCEKTLRVHVNVPDIEAPQRRDLA